MSQNLLLRRYLGITILCGLFFLLGICSLSNMIIYTPDSARYLVWANSLAHGEGLQDLSAPEPICYVVHAPMYPIFTCSGSFFLSTKCVCGKSDDSSYRVFCFAAFLSVAEKNDWRSLRTSRFTISCTEFIHADLFNANSF